jgi:hypothetical protein
MNDVKLSSKFNQNFKEVLTVLNQAKNLTLSALGPNLKYKLQWYIFHFCPIKYVRQPKKINTEQLCFKETMFPALGAQFPTYNRSENNL